MRDPHRTEGGDPTRYGAGSTEPSTVGYPPYTDPAYASQLPTYGAGYRPNSNPVTQSSRYGPPGQPPSGGPVGGDQGGPPEPPRSPRWLFVLAGGAVLLVVGLILALVIANNSAKKSTVTQLPTLPSDTAPPQVPANTTPIPSPSPSLSPSTTETAAPPPTESTNAGVAQTVVYTVNGEGRAISIAYIDTGGVLQTEFNVVLPWRKQVSLAPPASKSASVTVVNIGEQITCSVTVDGARVRQRTGTILTICAGAG